MNDYFYIKREFDDFAAFADSMRLWNVQMNQLHCGKSINKIKQLSLENAKLNHLVFNGHKTTVGDPPRGKTFAFWSGENSELVWRNKRIPHNSLMMYPSGAEHDVMTKGKNIHVHTITFPESVWSSSLTNREADSCHEQLSSQDLLILAEPDMVRLKHVFLSYFKTLDKTPERLDQESFRRKVEDHLLFEVKRALSLARDNHAAMSSRKTTQKAWEQIENIMTKAGDSLLHVNDLCSAAGVSERSLRRLFHDRFGISPKNYLNRIRLNSVRRDMKNCSYVDRNIADIANKHGFWHMGQFAADYRKLFGELPSQTSRINV